MVCAYSTGRFGAVAPCSVQQHDSTTRNKDKRTPHIPIRNDGSWNCVFPFLRFFEERRRQKIDHNFYNFVLFFSVFFRLGCDQNISEYQIEFFDYLLGWIAQDDRIVIDLFDKFSFFPFTAAAAAAVVIVAIVVEISTLFGFTSSSSGESNLAEGRGRKGKGEEERGEGETRVLSHRHFGIEWRRLATVGDVATDAMKLIHNSNSN